MGLLLGFDLQPVLHLPKQTVSAIKVDNFGLRNQFQASQRTKRVQGICFLEKRMPAAVNKLQCLHHKLDFADPAASQLYVTLEFGAYVVFDPALDLRNFVEQIRRRTSRINEGLMLAQKLVG